MDSTRKSAIAAGVLLLLAWAGGVLNVIAVHPILDVPNYLDTVLARGGRYTLGILCELVMSFSGAGVALAMYPVLRRFDEGLAIGSVGFRLLEAVAWMVDVALLLLISTLSRASHLPGAGDSQTFLAMGSLVLDARFGLDICAFSAFIIGAFMYYLVLFRARLIPVWLSSWGLVGAPLWLGATLLSMFRCMELYSTTQTLLFVPIALQELVMALWLILRGFDPGRTTGRA